MKLRIRFQKHGAVKFIGHLDVMRFFQKTIRRAGIDVAYSAGFSPHQIMTFAAPLGVGLESNGEYMDIEVNSQISCEDTKNRLNEASIPEIYIEEVKILPDNAGNAMASVFAAEYTVSFREGREPKVSMNDAVSRFMQKESIPIVKATKKGTRELDLKPGIFLFDWNGQSFHMILDASSGGNIKPIQVIEAMLNDHQETLCENALLITREDVYTNTGTEEAPVLTSLGAIGSNHE